MKYVYVECLTTGRNLWISQKYLELYPHMYKIILHNGKSLTADTVR